MHWLPFIGTLMALMLTAGCKTIDFGMCNDYLECVAAVTPSELAAAQAAYGDDGSCWKDEDAADLCRTACETVMSDMGDLWPGEPACGGSGGDDDDDDDTYPPYTLEIDLYGSSMEASCQVDVPSGGGTPEGTFWFGLDLVGWADRCWIELWDPSGMYFEGYDVDGDPCENSGYLRPGWAMDQTSHTWTSEDLWEERWDLELHYLANLAAADAYPGGASIFSCENAGNPHTGSGTFYTYFCCCDKAQPSYCPCVEFVDW